MRFEILGFNQELLTRNFPTLKADDLILLNYIYQAVASPTMKHILKDGVPYVWLHHAKIHEDLPILGISERTLKRYLKNYVELGLLTTVQNYDTAKGSTAFYAITETCESLRFTSARGVTADTSKSSQGDTSDTSKASQGVTADTSDNQLKKDNKLISIDKDICQKVVDYYHEKCPNLPRVRALTPKRRKAILTLLKKHSIQILIEVFEKANSSDFCCGRVNDWKADLDFILREDKFINLLEGRYDNRKTPKFDARTIEGGNIKSNYDRAAKDQFRKDIADGRATAF